MSTYAWFHSLCDLCALLQRAGNAVHTIMQEWRVIDGCCCGITYSLAHLHSVVFSSCSMFFIFDCWLLIFFYCSHWSTNMFFSKSAVGFNGISHLSFVTGFACKFWVCTAYSHICHCNAWNLTHKLLYLSSIVVGLKFLFSISWDRWAEYLY